MAATAKAIITPMIDVLCCGGLSILLICGFFFFAPVLPSGVDIPDLDFGTILLAQVLINWPHFMASYRLLYRSKEQIVQYHWASTYIPMFLFALAVYSMLAPKESVNSELVSGTVLELLLFAGMFLLAWHYTGQAWGMTASFCFIAGIRMDRLERLLIRSGYRALLVWHLLWALAHYHLAKGVELWIPEFRDHVRLVYLGWGWVVLLSIVAGMIGFVRIWRRTGMTPPLRAIVPWVAIYLWYLLIFFYPFTASLVFLQISHALQYLIFPIRVEMNQLVEKRSVSDRMQMLHAALYYLVLVLVSVVVYMVPAGVDYLRGADLELFLLISGSINLHHYFIDGAIWKISNPRVRKDLFAHLT